MKPYLMFGLRMVILSYGLTVAKEHAWLYFFLAFYGFMSFAVFMDELSKKSFDRQVREDNDGNISA